MNLFRILLILCVCFQIKNIYPKDKVAYPDWVPERLECQKQTREGVPIVSMWKCQRPVKQPSAGFSKIKNIENCIIYHATRESGAYNHHTRIVYHKEYFYAMWSNHIHGEGAPGMRVLYAKSKDGLNWTPWQELFPPPGPIKDFGKIGPACVPYFWIKIKGELYATAGVFSTIGFTNYAIPQSDTVLIRDDNHRSKVRKWYTTLARKLQDTGTWGPIVALWNDLPSQVPFSCNHAMKMPGNELLALLNTLYQYKNPAYPRNRKHVISFYQDSLHFSSEQLQFAHCGWPAAHDGHLLSEPTIYRAKDGRYIMLLRDRRYSHRMYVSISNDLQSDFPPAYPTDIPDSPSRSTNLVLSDGTLLLIGNQIAPEFDNWDNKKHYRRTPLTIAVSKDGYQFENVFALRSNAPDSFRIKGVKGRGTGFQYPGAIVYNDTLYVTYSIGKEDIGCTKFPVSEISNNE